MVNYRRSIPSRIFDTANVCFLIVVSSTSLLPFIYLLLTSFSTNQEIDRGALVPSSFSIDAYRAAFATPLLSNGFLISAFVTLAGTSISIALTTMMAYALSRKELPMRRALLFLVVLTMMVNAGIIPLYLVVRSLKLVDSIWSLILPSCIGAFNVILMRNFFLTIPDELEDAARLDGCSDLEVLVRIVVPLSGPALAVFVLFYGVNYWNTYFSAIMFINDPAKMPFQVALRQLLAVDQLQELDIARLSQLPYPQALRAAALVLSALPVLAVYPWVQRYFTTGLLLGGIKE